MASNTTVENPRLWSSPLGSKAEVASLPESVDTSLSAEASHQYLFPYLTERPVEQGGYPPRRTDFNALFKMLGDHIYFLQQGGHYQYDATVSYKRYAVVQYQGAMYVSKSGDNKNHTPSSEEGRDYWEPLVSLKTVNGIAPDTDGNVDLDLGLDQYAALSGNNEFSGTNTFDQLKFNELPTYEGDGALDPNSIPDNAFAPMSAIRELIYMIGGGGGGGEGSNLVRPVTITSPRADTKGNPVLMEFAGESYANAFEQDARSYREWQYTTTDDTDWRNAKTFKANADGFALNYASRLAPNTSYKVRARDVSTWNTYGPWSLNVLFTTGEDVGILTPGILSISGPDTMNVPENPQIQGSVFSTTSGRDTHYATQWQIRRLDNFEVVYDSGEQRANLTILNVARGILEENTSYEVSVRYKGATYGWSDYGTATFTTAPRFTYVQTPSVAVEGNGDNVPEDPYFNSSVFRVESDVGDRDTHVSTTWVVSNTDDVVVWQSENDKTNLRTIHMPKGFLEPLSQYTVRVQYKGRQFQSDWGEARFMTAADFAHIATPVLTVAGAPDNVPETATLTGSAFTVQPQGRDHDTHVSTDWVIYDAEGESEAWSSKNDTEHLTSITVPADTLEPDQTYLFTVLYRGKALGESERAEVSGTTKENFTYIETPTLTVEGAPDNVRETPTLTGTAFKVVSDTEESDTHHSTDYKVTDNTNQAVVFEQTITEPDKLTSLQLPYGTLEEGKSYKFQIRYNGTRHGSSGWATVDALTHESLAFIATPTLTVTGAPTSVPETPTLSLSPFTVTSDNEASDTHASTDWEIVPQAGGAAVWQKLKSSNLTTITVEKGILQQGTTYRVRARFHGTRLGASDWVEQSITTLSAFDFVNTPTISVTAGMISGATDVLETPTFKTSAFAYTSSSGGVDTHHATEWKVTAAASPEVSLWTKSLTSSDTDDLTTVTMDAGVLQPSQAYKVFARHQGLSFGWSNWGELSFSTNNVFTYVQKPVVYVPGAPSSVEEAPTITTGPFTLAPSGSDVHQSTDWIIEKTSDNGQVFSSIDDSSNLTSIAIPKAKLQVSTEYRVKVRFKSATYGYSAWTEVTFTTVALFSPVSAPGLSVESDSLGVFESPLLTGAAFVNTSGLGGDNHSATDWKVMKANDRSVVWSSSTNTQSLTSIRVPQGKLENSISYIFAVRYQALTSGWGPWTEVTGTTQATYYAANQPTLLNANIDRAGTKLRFEFSVPQLVVRPGATAPTHLRVKVENKTQSNMVDQFTVAIESSGNYVLERENAYDLLSGDNIEYEVFYKNSASDDDDGGVSAHCTRRTTVNENILVMLETLGNADHSKVSSNPYIAISLNFGPQSFTHIRTDWEIKDVTDTVSIWSSKSDTVNVTNILANANLALNTIYNLHITAYGLKGEAETSSKPVTIQFKTSNGGEIGKPGTMGFGVGVYPGDDLDTLGLVPMAGYTDPLNENYGNYQRSDGSVLVFIPAFVYSFSDKQGAESASGFGVRSFNDFGYDETLANSKDYIVHEAFLDGTQTKSGFFIAKYLMSKGLKSIKDGIPISLCSSGSDACSSAEGHGAVGNATDALTLSKTWGTGYNCASVYMYSALAMLSLCHGWHATGTDACAWYDAAGTTNFPKGCNNNALGDQNDSTILYTNSDTQQKTKPNTGSANHFAKTTHNGQLSGVCDINGCIEQMGIGATKYGSTNYVRAETAKFVDFTKDNVNSNNSAVYRSANTTDVSSTWGKAGTNCFTTDKNGVSRALCGLIPANSATGGTNEFGSDTAAWYRGSYGGYYGAMRCCGSWSSGAGAGVWYRYCCGSSSGSSYSWAYGYACWGFRAALYGTY